MLPVYNVSIHRCCTHWWCSHFCVVTSFVIPLDILIVASKQVKWSLLRNMITVQEDRRNLPRNLGFWLNANILSAPFKIQQPKLDSYNRIRSKGAHCSFEGDGVPGQAALWEGGWVARVGLCGDVWGCVELCGARGRGRQPDCSGKGRIRRSLQGDTAARCTKMLPNTRNNGHWNSFFVQETNPSVNLSSPQW